jgi:hypothetical protein
MTMKNPTLFNRLKKKYGNHTEVAQALGITPRHYRRIRGAISIKPSLRMLMEFLIKLKDKA